MENFPTPEKRKKNVLEDCISIEYHRAIKVRSGRQQKSSDPPGRGGGTAEERVNCCKFPGQLRLL